jgi:heme-degrading monooxygenase HmoA
LVEVSMAMPLTHTTWRVKPGQEGEFVRRWKEWADWSHEEGLRAHARLLRDVENPSTFISFGPWETMDAVRSWRSKPGYHERVARLQQLVEQFEPRTLEQVAES